MKPISMILTALFPLAFRAWEFQADVENGWNQVQLWLLKPYPLFKVHIYWFPQKLSENVNLEQQPKSRN